MNVNFDGCFRIPLRAKKMGCQTDSPGDKTLFFLNIFQTVKRYCYENNNTGEYKLEVCINTKDRK